MPSFEVLELSLFSYAFILKADFGWIFMRKIFPLFPFLCCFRFLCYGVPSLLLLFLFCSIGLANRKFSLVCVILLVRSIYYCYCIISDCLSFFCFLFNLFLISRLHILRIFCALYAQFCCCYSSVS